MQVIDFVRGGVTAYLVIVAAFGLLGWASGDIAIEVFAAILIFCGIGVTAASTLSGGWDWRHIIGLAGVTISTTGAGIEVDLAFKKFPPHSTLGTSL